MGVCGKPEEQIVPIYIRFIMECTEERQLSNPMMWAGFRSAEIDFQGLPECDGCAFHSFLGFFYFFFLFLLQIGRLKPDPITSVKVNEESSWGQT